ncbi:MAG: hypothetical protein DA328_08690 [Nitrososphaeraceae archaeon]|nr:hypothetical protein [Nitrososphaeraceae archaeon]
MKLEYWLGLVSIGLSVMFISYVLSFYNYLGSQQKEIDRLLDIDGVLIKAISISAAPSLILSGIVYGLIRSYGGKIPGILLIISGVIMVIGMIFSYSLTPIILKTYHSTLFDLLPLIFIIAGTLVSVVGTYLLFKSRKSSSISDSTIIKGR